MIRFQFLIVYDAIIAKPYILQLVGRSYADIVLSEEFSVLRELLKTDFPQRYSLAKEFLSTCTLSEAEVISFFFLEQPETFF